MSDTTLRVVGRVLASLSVVIILLMFVRACVPVGTLEDNPLPPRLTQGEYFPEEHPYPTQGIESNDRTR